MARIAKIRRLANPFKGRVRRRKVNPVARVRPRHKARRKLTAKQLKYFGTARQKAARKAALKRKRTRVVVKAANPVRRRRKNTARRRTRKANPAFLVTLGAVNPRRRKVNSMAKTKRRRRASRAPVVHRRRRHVVAASNPHRRRSQTYRAKAQNPYRRRRRVIARHNPRRRHRNPSVFGSKAFSASGLKLIGGGLVGVAAAKFIPKMLPASLTSSLGTFGALVATGVSAFAAAFIAEKALGPEIGNAVLFGGLMQTASVGLTMAAPGFSVGGVPLALSGLGDLLPGHFVVPQNPLRLPPPPPAAGPRANLTMNGLARAFGPAF